MKNFTVLFFYILFFTQGRAQLPMDDSIAKKSFFSEEKKTSQSFNTYFNRNISVLYGLEEKEFITLIDSLRTTFTGPLDKLCVTNPGIGNQFFEEQYTDLDYTFNKFILDYPPVHKRITGKETTWSKTINKRLQKVKISDPNLLQYSAFRKYLGSLLEQALDKELKINQDKYKHSDNQRLDAGLAVIDSLFKNTEIRNRMRYEILYSHIDNYGIKDIKKQLQNFSSQCTDQSLVFRIDSLYSDETNNRKAHVIEPYKEIGTHNLDLHIFLPKDNLKKHPAIVFFHGGGWSEGKPDWFFGSCQEYAQKGWVAVAVEYRVRNRHGNLPPDAIADGKSAIRYLRINANRLGISPNKIVASGNSAGANLALALAVIDTLDDNKENRDISSRPNAVILNSVAPDFTQGDFWQQYFKNKDFLKRISPLDHIRPNLPQILIVQGNQDHNVPLESVIEFAEKMKTAGNDCELHILDGAGHFLWYDRNYSSKVEEFQTSFLKRLGYW
jgi:acetyl esterase/lipase